jgi:hypothetical protein
MQTDYSNLNDRIVKQAYEVSNLTLTEEMKTRLFENKIRRAVEMIQAREASPVNFLTTDSKIERQVVAGNEDLCYTIT